MAISCCLWTFPISGRDPDCMERLAYTDTESLLWDYSETEEYYVLAIPPVRARRTLYRVTPEYAFQWFGLQSNLRIVYYPFSQVNFRNLTDPCDCAPEILEIIASITVSPSSVEEDSGTHLVYTVRLDTTSTFDTNITYSLSGSATVGEDYTVTPSSPITILAGQTTGTITVTPISDGLSEFNETVIITLLSGTSGTNIITISPTNASATGTIEATVLPISSVGINLSGAENSFPDFVGAAEISYYVDKGFTRFRLPISWSKVNEISVTTGIQLTTFAALDATYTFYLDAVLDIMAGLGVTTLLDIHRFGIGPGGFNVGTVEVPVAAFADLWSKISLRYKDNVAIHGYDLMNEWVNGFDSAVVFAANQAAIDAIRANGDTTPIYVEGTNFSGAWNWVTGEGQPYNNSNLYLLTDSANNLVFSAHSYLDNDSSGRFFSYAVESALPGLSPPGVPTSASIGLTRLQPFIDWCALHNVRGHIGEMGTSSDPLVNGGNYDFDAWNLAIDNAIAYANANGIEVDYWGAGPGFPTTYPASPASYSTSEAAVKDFTSTGVQAPVLVILQNHNGYGGTQPTAYQIILPQLVTPTGDPEAPTVAAIYYTTSGVASDPFTVYYGGKIPSPVTITPHASFVDGTAAGGTFTPPTITLGVGDNALATFTYTAATTATIKISTTNNAGWTDPPALSISSIADPYVNLPVAALTNIYGVYNRFTPNTGPALRLQRLTDNVQADWGFTNAGNLDRVAIQAWASARRSIRVVTMYGIGPGATNPVTATNPIVFTSAEYLGTPSVTLDLDNSAGYPEIVCTWNTHGDFNTPINGKTELSVIARANIATGTPLGLFRMDQFLGPILWGPTTFSIIDTGWVGSTNVGGAVDLADLSLGVINDVYHDYGATYASGVSNGFKTWKDGVVVAQTTVTYTLNAAFSSPVVNFGYFRFVGGLSYIGSLTNLEFHEGLALSAGQLQAIMTADANYYAVPLPDTLPLIPPTIVNAEANQPIYPGSVPAHPFRFMSLLDQNTGGPTDTLTITLVGAAGTLAGTGITGTGPYTIGPDTAANITTFMQDATFTTANVIGNVTAFHMSALSSVGTSSTNNGCSTIVTVYLAETPFAAPGGVFTPKSMKGVNISGGEFTWPSSSQFNYAYPQNAEIDYWAAKGFGVIRMPVYSRRLQPVSYGPLDPADRTDEPAQAYRTYPAGSQTNLLAIKDVLDYALTKNMYVAIDEHGFGYIWDTTALVARNIGFDVEGRDQIVNFWSRVATKFKNYPNVIFDIQNEPVGMTAADWKITVDAILAAIAAVTTARKVWVCGGSNFSGAHDWTSSGNAAAFSTASFTPPVGMTVYFEPHQYLDSDNSGTHSTVVADKGATVLADITAWAVTNNRLLILGEMGWSYDDAQLSGGVPSTEGSALMSYMTAHSAQWAGWTYWVGGNSLFYGPFNGVGAYTLSAVPGGYPSGPFTDAPQTNILIANQHGVEVQSGWQRPLSTVAPSINKARRVVASWYNNNWLR